MFFFLVKVLLPPLGLFIVATVWLWACIRIPMKGEACPNQANCWQESYVNIFSKLFWFAIMGPIGLSMQYVCELVDQAVCEKDGLEQFKTRSGQILALVDWVPVRLFGLSCALVGDFSQVFSKLVSYLTPVLSNQYELAHLMGESAFANSTDDRYIIVMRLVWLWLAALSLVSIGQIL